MSSDDLTKDLDDHALLLQLVTLFRAFDARQRAFDARQRDFDVRQRDFDVRQRQLSERLQALDEKVDKRLYDTRPMWEAVQVQISKLREEVAGRISELHEQTEKGFRRIGSKIELLAKEVRDLYADERELERRVGTLESKAS